jgi:hypothetical protein
MLKKTDPKKKYMKKWQLFLVNLPRKLREESKEKQNSIKNKFKTLLTKKGIPNNLRGRAWKFLIGNRIQMNRDLFKILF